MPRGSFHAILDYVRRIAHPSGGGPDESDSQLLRRFTDAGDQAAFATLVRRHGPMVWGVCTRALPIAQDAEDAFQATFLVLVRKARSLSQPEQLSPWLYGVARRTALKARAEATRRRARENAVMDRPAQEASDVLRRELRQVLDEEVSRLPARYRTPFLLCYLEGLTNDEAARRLGCPKGTILSRLSRAREILRGRLARRGLGLSASALSVALPDSLSAAVPSALVESTIRLSISYAAGMAVSALSAPAAVLAEGVLKAMFLTKVKLVVVVFLSLGLVGSGVGFLTHGTNPGQPVAVAQESPVPSPVRNKDDKKEQPQRDESKAEVKALPIEERTRELRDKLDMPVVYHGIEDNRVTLGEILDQFTKLFDLSFNVDENAFKMDGVADVLKQDLVHNNPIPPMKTSLGNVLRKILDRVEGTSLAMHLVRGGNIEITTINALRSELGIPNERPLLPLIWEEFEKVSLPTALQRLAKGSGMNVVLDPRASTEGGEKLTVSARFANVPVDTAVRILANMADLQMVRLDNVLYVTTPKRALQLKVEEPKGLDAAPTPPPPSPRQFGHIGGGA
jgi:RNA polymerase sigma factor (sigma-70 family)